MKKEFKVSFNEREEKSFFDLVKSLVHDAKISESSFIKYCFVRVIVDYDGKIINGEDLSADIRSMKRIPGVHRLLGTNERLLDPKVLESMSYFLQHQLKHKKEVKEQ